MSKAEELRRTPRGQLQYDRHWFSLHSFKAVVDEIQSDLDSTRPRPVSPGGYLSPPSFGLGSDSESDSPLLPRAERMTERRPAPAVAAQSRAAASEAAGAAEPADAAPEPSPPRSPAAGPSTAGDDPAVTADVTRDVTGPATSTPRAGHARTPFTPRTYDKLLHEQKQIILEEAREEARARLAAAEATLQQLRLQYQLRRRQLAAEQRQRGQLQREQSRLQRQQSEQQLQQKHERIEQMEKMRAKDLSERVQAAVERQQADEEELRQKAAHERALLDQMVAAQKQMRAVFARVVSSIRGCGDRAQLQASPAAGQLEQLKQLVTRMDALSSCPPGQLRIEDAEALVEQAQQLAQQVVSRIDAINSSTAPSGAAGATNNAKAAAEPAAATAASPAGPAQPAAETAKPAAKPAEPAAPTAEQAAVAGKAAEGQPTAAVAGLSGFVLEENRVWYEELQQKMQQFRAGFADLLADPSLKKFKFDCQKAVNTPINAISPVSAAHLRDKLDKLRRLLRGQPVPVAGQGQVSAAAHPRGLHFCLDLVAKKFVRQGEDVVSSKPEAAFALAAVLCALQLEFPELADLTLAHCHARCPYLVPLYPPQLEGDTDEQYYRKLGYDYVDGAVEKQDKFLKRMSGVARLYAALLVCRAPQSAGAARRPLGLRHAWRWLASVVNLEPRVDITASLIHDVLEVAGSALAAAYGAQFVKLIKLLNTKYLPLVRQVTPAGCGGPLVRLEQQLQNIVRTGGVPPPPGELKVYGW